MAIYKLKCKHEQVQNFTECCLQCGVNVWSAEADRSYRTVTKEEYEEAKRNASKKEKVIYGDFENE